MRCCETRVTERRSLAPYPGFAAGGGCGPGGGTMFVDTIAIAFWPTIVGLFLLGWFRRRDDGTLALTWAAAASAAWPWAAPTA